MVSDDMNGQVPGTGDDTGGMPPQAAGAVAAPPAPPVPPAPPGTADPDRNRHHEPHEHEWKTGGAVFGALLVLAGLVALFGGFTSVFDLFRLWPLLIVFGGLMRIVTPRNETFLKRLAEGLGSVAVGLVFLGNTFGFIPWTVWITLLSLWPLLLIAIGIELVGRGLHMDWLRALSNVVLILGLAYGVFVLQPTSGRVTFPFVTSSAASVAFSDSKPHDAGATSGSAEIKVGATQLTLGAGDVMASIDGRSPASDTPKLTTSVEGSSAVVSVTEPSDSKVFIGTEDRSIAVKLDRSVDWSDIRLDVGAVSADADLSGLKVSGVTMNVGASDAKIKIGSLAKDVTVSISGGATSVTVRVPSSAACTIDSSSGLSNVRVPPTFRQTSGIVVVGNSTFVSDGSGGPTIHITLSSGVSDLSVETY
jgi:hypothetical protein